MNPLVRATRNHAAAVDQLRFGPPVHTVYNPLIHARAPHENWLAKLPRPARILFVGMNPGPWGMTQTGVPFGEVCRVRDWLGIRGTVCPPAQQHPKRPVEGFACTREEVSGARLWDWFRGHFTTADRFFEVCAVHSYCPLTFLAASGANLTPDKLRAAGRKPLEALCDTHLSRVLEILQPRQLVAIGVYAGKALTRVAPGRGVVRILHPSPASPAANRDWAGSADRQLDAAGIFLASP